MAGGQSHPHFQARAARNSDGTYSETTGGNANTWTNYTNAGGYQGPTIPGYSTVSVACVVQGFRVADGNTNWYLIAASPWSYQYYVSADAFYNNGQTSGSLRGTPFVDPAVPSCNAQQGGIIETAGGAANTWTNYTNAGGTQGPTVGGGASIAIACKVQGFRVADGNTWWYRIAQAPWNSAYYVSADAFYNNGQTSGSLRGTPFVDPSVPDCSSGGSTPSGGLAEAVGGDANTWSNYLNAGGYRGPTIPNGTTVTIACKRTGFRVADGNTWWYLVSSSPWNGNYYVSADAFYNNGQTSGSLRGTPFVDPAVPDCVDAGQPRPPGETAIGDANTFGNYSKAGRVGLDPVRGGQTVSVSCRVQGFRAPDGNDWWYLLSSAPWNNVYYVSASAFYNDNRTSGPAGGAPLFDAAVPVCVDNKEMPLYAASIGAGQGAGDAPACQATMIAVDCASGNFSRTATDVSVLGRGPGLALTRTYNGLNPSSAGLFGYGWTSSYDQHLLLPDGRADGSIGIVLDDGSQIPASPQGNGFSTPVSSDATFSKNDDGTYTFVRHHLLIETFSSTGKLLWIADLNGNKTTLSYDADGRLTRVGESGGRALDITVGATGHLSAVKDPMGRSTTYTYDDAGNLASVTSPGDRTTVFTYGVGHRMQTLTTPRGGTLTNTYDELGRVTKQVDPAGRTTTLAYTGDSFGSMGGSTTVTDSHGAVTVARFANGFLTEETSGFDTAEPATWRYTYDPETYGVATQTDPSGRVTTNDWDSAGNLLSTKDALGHSTSYTYNALGQQLSTTMPEGESSASTYDANGNSLTTTDAVGKTMTFGHGNPTHPGDVTSVTDPDGRVAQMTYDTFGNLATKTVHPTPGVDQTSLYAHDADGAETCVASPAVAATGTRCPPPGAQRAAKTKSSEYDGAGRLASTTDPLGRTTSQSYDDDGNVTRVTDPTGHVTTSTYDLVGRVLTEQTDASSTSRSITRYAYDVAPGSSGCPAAAAYCETKTDPTAGVTVHAYNVLGQETRTIRPSGENLAFTYDLMGNVRTRTSNSGTVKTMTRDDLDRVTGVSYSDGSTPAVAFRFDADGRRTSMIDATGTTNYSYDADGRPKTITNGAGLSVGYGYDGRGDVTRITYPNGKDVLRTFDGAGRMTSVRDWRGKITSFTYSPDAQLLRTDLPNGDLIGRTYDVNDNVSETSLTGAGGPLATITYSRAANGRVSSETGSGATAGTRKFTYDGRDQLLAAGSEKFGYDQAGRTTSMAGVTQQFDESGRIKSTAATLNTQFGYDANGNRVTATPGFGRTINAHYDDENRLLNTAAEAPRPTVSSLSSTSGPLSGGATLTMTGTGLSEVNRVIFGGVPATRLTIASDTKLTIVVPVHDAGAVDVNAEGPGGTSSATPYTYKPTPGVTGVLPAAGPEAGGTLVTVSGAGFTGVNQVRFGSVPGSSVNILSDRKLTVVAPAGVGAKSITVKTASASSAVATAGRFSYGNTPIVTGLDVSRGPLSGTPVKIAGAGFTGATQVNVGSQSVPFTVTSDAEIATTIPVGTGVAQVQVSGPTGTSPLSSVGRFTYAPKPTVSGLSALTGSASGGTTVTITGTGFTDTSSVKFGGVKAAARVVSTAKIVVIAPRGTGTKDVTVETEGGTATSRSPFRYADPVTSMSYDGDGQRTSRRVNGTDRQFVWAGSMVIDDETNFYIYGPDGLPIEQLDRSDSAMYFFHDANGSTRALTDQTGAIAATFEYTAYGQLRAAIGDTTTPLLYGRGYLDADSGLIYLVNRFYDPSTGQFLSVDPALDSTGDGYGYASADPINNTDPLGLWGWSNIKKWASDHWDEVAEVGVGAAGVACAVTVACGVGVLSAAGALGFAGTAFTAADVLLACTPPQEDCGEEVAIAGLSLGMSGVVEGVRTVGELPGAVPIGRAGTGLLDGTVAVVSSTITIGRAAAPTPSAPAANAVPPDAGRWGPSTLSVAPARSTASNLQPTYSPQRTYNPQPATYNPQPATYNPQQASSLPFGGRITSVGVANPGRLRLGW